MNILNEIISLVFVFLVFAIVVSGLQEWWSQYRGQRGQFLRIGMQRLVDDEAIFVRVLQHPLVGGLYRDRAARGKPPSYVEPDNFALALANVLQRRAGQAADGQPLTFESLRGAVEFMARQNSPVADALLPILDRADGRLDTALRGIEAWFAGGMDRVSGWYKAYAQRRIFAIGLIVAILGNVDAIAIYQALNRSPALAAQLAESAAAAASSQRIGDVDLSQLAAREPTPEEAQAVLKAALATPLNQLPIGYACLSAVADVPLVEASEGPASTLARCRAELAARAAHWGVSDWLVHLLGWILTAFAGTLGAPYWFSLLSKITSIRGSGPKPKPVESGSA